MLIRELDGLLDNVFHSFWIFPAVITAIVVSGAVLRYFRSTVLPGFFRFVELKSYPFFILGLIIVMVFSQTFGSGSFLWRRLLQDDYSNLFKTVLQEGLELLGYIFVYYGTCLYYRSAVRYND